MEYEPCHAVYMEPEPSKLTYKESLTSIPAQEYETSLQGLQVV